MPKNKRQHTVQKAYLEQWTQEGIVQVYDMQKKVLHEGDPKTLFRENYIYNLEELGEEQKSLIDEMISQIEKEGLPVIEELIEGRMNQEGKMRLANYITVQSLRTPRTKEMIHELLKEEAKKRLIDQLKDPTKKAELLTHEKFEVQELIEELAKDPERKVPELFDEKLKMEVENVREIWLQTLVSVLKDLSASNYNGSWFLYKAGKKHAFITSDNPVVTMSSVKRFDGATSKDVLYTEVTFPLTPKYILVIRKNSVKRTFPHNLFVSEVYEDGASIKEFNWRTATHSDRFIVSHSDKLAEKIAQVSHEDWEETRYTLERAKQEVKGEVYVKKAVKSHSIKPLNRTPQF